MSYFDQILNGNMPVNVIQAMESYPQNYMLNKDFKHYKLYGDSHTDEHIIMNSSYGAYIASSLEMDREKVGSGLMTILKSALADAIRINNNNLKLFKSDNEISSKDVNNFASDFGRSIINSINNLSIDKKMKELLIHTLHLTGVTNKNKQEMEDSRKQISIVMELPQTFKTNKELDISKILVSKLSRDNLKKCSSDLSVDCVFGNDFLFKLTSALMDSMEHVLGSIMNEIKHDKVCEFYAFSVELANQLSNISNKPKTIETLIDAGNSTKLSDSTKIKDLKEINKKIDQSKVIKGMSKMISDVVNDVVSKNSADLMRTIAVSNKITLASVKGTSFNFSNIKQTGEIDTKLKSEFAQAVTTKIQNEIANKIKDNIDSATKQFDKDVKKSTTDEKKGTNIGDIVGSVGEAWGKTMETVGKVLSNSVGNSVEQSTSKDISQEMKDTFDLNQSFKYEKNDDAKNVISNVLKTENLSKCAADSKLANDVELGKIDVSGPINISGIQQESIVKDVMECAFNQEVVNDIATKVLNDFDKLIKAMIENVNDKLTDEQKTAVQGDIYAVGTAGSAILESAGNAVDKAGSGVSKAAEGIGSGVGKAAEGVGKGIGSILGGMIAPLIIGAVIIVLLIVGYIMFRRFSAQSNDEDDGELMDDEEE
jgi:hypothetical protein